MHDLNRHVKETNRKELEFKIKGRTHSAGVTDAITVSVTDRCAEPLT